MTRMAIILLALISCAGCAMRHPVRAWRNSEAAYERWWWGPNGPGQVCLAQGHTREECDPDWKLEVQP